MFGDNDWFLIVWALICIIVVLAMSYWVTRYVAGRGMLRRNSSRRVGGRIELLVQEPIGRDQRLVVAKVGEKYFLLGVTANSISLLSELSSEDVNNPLSDAVQETKENPSFLEALADVLKQKTRR